MSQDSNFALANSIQAAQIVVPCTDLATALEFFTSQLGFRVEAIFPADAPAVAVISGHGATLRLEAASDVTFPAKLRLLCDLAALPAKLGREFVAPGGLRVELAEANPPLTLPPGTQEFVISRQDETAWNVGRAGMEYRDLIPGRLGGRFVASHIRIPAGGPVPDYVHFHKVRFQMIYCRAGWARLIYEDQGPPFVMEAGDCVLQPPEIRHRVLEASAGFEVIEISCPAAHETHADHDMPLPTPHIRPARLFHGQRFVHHSARAALWQTADGYQYRDTGLAHATNGLASACVIRASGTYTQTHTGEFLGFFILHGELTLNAGTQGTYQLQDGAGCVIPTGLEYTLQAVAEAELLEVALPACRNIHFKKK